MNNLALDQANVCLRRAQLAHDRLVASKTFDEAEHAWSDFLAEAHTFFLKLEIATNGNAKAMPWFGSIKNQRNTDPLLRYIHFARNADEHCIEDHTRRSPAGLQFTPVDGPVYLKPIENPDGSFGFEVHPSSPGRLEMSLVPDRLILLPAVNHRARAVCDPPREHLGYPLKEASAVEVAGLALDYLKQVSAQAATFL